MKKNNKTLMYGTIVAILLLVAIGLSLYINNTSEDEIYTCANDSDCIAAQNGCCGCTAGGSNTAINKNYLNEWNKDIADVCTNILCPQVISSDTSCFAEPKCIKGKCTLQS